MSKRNIKSKEEAPMIRTDIELHGDDVAFVARTVKDSYRTDPLSEAERIETIVWKLGPIAEYRKALDPSIPTRAYLRKMLQAALLVDIEMEHAAREEAAAKRARMLVSAAEDDLIY